MKRWWIDTKDKPGLLWGVLTHFQDNGTVSLEGDLEPFHLEEIPGAAFDETSALKRQTIDPKLYFVTLPITQNTITALKARLAHPGIFKDTGALIHAQVESGGRLLWLAADNFHRECVSAFPPFPEHLLEQLKKAGVIREYKSAA